MKGNNNESATRKATAREEVDPHEWPRPLVREHMGTPFPTPAGGSSIPGGKVIIDTFFTVREGLSLICFKWQFYKTFLKHKWHVW